ncbi:MAG: hypothetical protein Q4P25_02950 [Tissierellia bacterium]|nr:hypothetical protein [Tissierellia bacterium]
MNSYIKSDRNQKDQSFHSNHCKYLVLLLLLSIFIVAIKIHISIQKDNEQTVTIGTRQIDIEKMTIEFGIVNEEDPTANFEKRMYSIPDSLVQDMVHLLETSLIYELDSGYQLADMPEDYMIIQLNPSVTLDITCRREFYHCEGETLWEEPVPPGDYLYFNYWDHSDPSENSSSLFLSKINMVEEMEKIIRKHHLKPL